MFCLDKIKYEHLANLFNLKSCQFAPRIAIFNLSMCCQFEDLKIIPMSHHNHLTVTNAGSFLCGIFFRFLLVGLRNPEFLQNLIKNYCIRTHFNVV